MNRLDHDEVVRRIDVDAELLYDLVSDVRRTPEWSPEVVGCSWLDGASGPSVGARFKARNRRRWFSWTNKPEVTVADPGRAFVISRTEPGGGTIEWGYRLEPGADGGTEVTLFYDVRSEVPLILYVLLRVLLGVRDLKADLHENMLTSLSRLAEVAQREAASRNPR